MAGAFGASIIYKQRGQKEATAIVETGSPNPDPVASDGQSLSRVSGGTTSHSHASASSTSEDIEDLVTGDGRKNAAATKARKPTPPISQSAKSGQANETWQDGAGNQGDEKELHRSERIEARRLKRSAEREARRDARSHKSRPSDDLLRIREIFEGSPRP
jgi:hypothetical protein